MSYTITPRETDASRDPFTGAPDAHPVRTAIGAALGGAAAGAATGTVAGPVGTLIGAVVGAIVGGLTVAYRPYIERGSGFDDYYGPAYCYGDKAYTQYPGHRVEEVGVRPFSRLEFGARQPGH